MPVKKRGLVLILVVISLSLSTRASSSSAQSGDSFVQSIAWKPDSSQYAVGYQTGTIEIRDATTNQRLRTFPTWPDEPSDSIVHFIPYSIAWNPDGSKIAAALTAESTGLIRIFDAETGTVLSTFTADNWAMAVTWSPDGALLAGSVQLGWDGAAHIRIDIWDAPTGQLVASLDHNGYDGRLSWLSWSPDGSRLISVSYDHTGIVWDTTTWQPLVTIEDPAPLYTVEWSPDGSRFATGSADGSIRIWTAAGTLQQTLPNGYEDKGVYQVSWHPDGSRLAGAVGRAVQIWDTDTGLLLETFEEEREYGTWFNVAWSPDGSQLLYTIQNGTDTPIVMVGCDQLAAGVCPLD
jgi:WD40 repeat protein